jgi:perosamine synthetase
MEPWLGQEEKDALLSVVDSGWFTEHKKTKEFEQTFADYVGSKYALAATSGTAALYLALKALGIKQGDEVVVPDLTFVATPNAVEACGATPVLVDIEKDTLCLDLDETKKKIRARTKAILPVHFNGRCPNIKRLLEIGEEKGVPIVEDACHTLGSKDKGKHLGTFGTIGVFSFSTPKVITTGQGGMVVTDDKELHERIMMLKDFGRDMTKKHDMIHSFEHVVVGYNFKFTEFQAAVGLAQMRKLEWRIERKKEMYRMITNELADAKEVEFLDLDLNEKSPWFNDCLLKDLRSRGGLVDYLESRNIGTRLIYPPIHALPPYSHVDGSWPVTDEISQRGLWLPSSTFLSNEEVTRVCAEIRTYLNR